MIDKDEPPYSPDIMAWANDIVERLRDPTRCYRQDCLEAADEIERLRRINEAYTATVAANKYLEAEIAQLQIDLNEALLDSARLSAQLGEQSGKLVEALKEEAEWTLTQTDNVGSPYYTARVMREAAARIRELEKELEDEWHRAEENEHWRKVTEAKNARLRGAMLEALNKMDRIEKNRILSAALQGEKE